jgi:hypothetical protein
LYRLFFIQNPPVYITRELQLPLVEFFGGRSDPHRGIDAAAQQAGRSHKGKYILDESSSLT